MKAEELPISEVLKLANQMIAVKERATKCSRRAVDEKYKFAGLDCSISREEHYKKMFEMSEYIIYGDAPDCIIYAGGEE